MPLVVWESFRAVFYAPYYAAFARGAFEAEGVDAVLGAVPPGTDMGDALRAGTVDVIWGGPMRVMCDHDRQGDSDLVCFAEVVARDPFSLVGTVPRPDFALSDLLRQPLATVSEVPTPWMCLQEDLRRDGIDPDRVERIADRTMAENADAIRRGEIPVAQLFEPEVEALVSEGAGHVWYAAADRGLTSYTTFYARRGLLETRPEEVAGLVRAIARTQRWMHGVTVEVFAETVAPYFPHLSRETLVGAVARYRRNGVWADDPVLPEEGFSRLAAGLVSGGLIRRAPPYAACVDTSFAEAAMADLAREEGTA